MQRFFSIRCQTGKYAFMKPSNYFMAAFAGVAILMSSCSKDNDVSDKLVGTWQWVRTDGGLAYHIHHTPASTGKFIDLKIARGNRYYIYTNGILTSQGTFTISTQNCIHDHEDKAFLDFSGNTERDMMIEDVTDNELHLSDNAHDGIGSLYTRK